MPAPVTSYSSQVFAVTAPLSSSAAVVRGETGLGRARPGAVYRRAVGAGAAGGTGGVQAQVHIGYRTRHTAHVELQVALHVRVGTAVSHQRRRRAVVAGGI